jgi:putative pyruvate formate lyase activating enzyme
MDGCTVCPRMCRKPRPGGFCRMGELPRVARAALHHWEEPCISGTRGSGAVFFSGCSLRCVFCQNETISRGGFGKEISVERLREIFEELIAQGAHNINLVNPTHFAPAIARALEKPLPVPVIYNCGGYERVETLRMLEGKIQIYLPDLKYLQQEPAARYSGAADYPEVAQAAIAEMIRQTGPYRLDEDGMLIGGTLIRHLILPRHLENTRRVIDWVAALPKGTVLFSLMSQYTPCGDLSRTPEIDRRLTRREEQAAQAYLFASGIEDGFVQERESAQKEYVPPFDLTGV